MFDLIPFGRPVARLGFNPFREMEELEKQFFGRGSLVEFRTDIRDRKDSYLLEADLPGFAKEDIHIELDGDYMTIRAERQCNKEETDENGSIVRSERSYGSFARSFDVGDVNTEDISAAYENGVLKLTMPKKQPVFPEKRRLEIQ